MGIFGFFFIILPIILFLIVLGIGVTLVRNILRFFGLGRTSSRSYDSYADSGNNRQQQQASSTASPSKPKKVIDDDEGEYVEFEEVKP